MEAIKETDLTEYREKQRQLESFPGEIEQLKKNNESLEGQKETLQNKLDFLEDCITELVLKVY